jgi:hypothetical protein
VHAVQPVELGGVEVVIAPRRAVLHRDGQVLARVHRSPWNDYANSTPSASSTTTPNPDPAAVVRCSSPRSSCSTASLLSCRPRVSIATATSACWRERPLTGSFRGVADRLFMAGSSSTHDFIQWPLNSGYLPSKRQRPVSAVQLPVTAGDQMAGPDPERP